MRAAHRSDVTIGVLRDRHPPPWDADVFVSDLTGAWRVLHALPAARAATDGAVRLSASASAIGALMLIPGVPGRSSTSVNVGMAASLWFGYRAAAKVFRDPLPEPETVPRLARPAGGGGAAAAAPPPRRTRRGRSTASWQQLPPVRALHGATAASWGLVRDFADEMRDDLSDPITPLLATGALASALLGSPLDAVLVGSVLLVNAALSAEQQLHAERILNRLLAVQDPPARRRVGSLEATAPRESADQAAASGRHHRSPCRRGDPRGRPAAARIERRSRRIHADRRVAAGGQADRTHAGRPAGRTDLHALRRHHDGGRHGGGRGDRGRFTHGDAPGVGDGSEENAGDRPAATVEADHPAGVAVQRGQRGPGRGCSACRGAPRCGRRWRARSR